MKKLIVGKEVVSEPGAGIKITALKLSAFAQEGLSTHGVRIRVGDEDSAPIVLQQPQPSVAVEE